MTGNSSPPLFSAFPGPLAGSNQGSVRIDDNPTGTARRELLRCSQSLPLIAPWRSATQMRTIALICLVLMTTFRLQAGDSCINIRGRAHLHGGDGQLRIWQVGTHHDYTPDASSREAVVGWLEAGVSKSEQDELASPASQLYLFADFVICPTEPWRKGAVQQAKVKSASHRRYVHIPYK
jgi:hypothetical protein